MRLKDDGTYEFRIILLGDGHYGEDEKYVENQLGSRRFTGTPNEAMAFARRTRVGATGARFLPIRFRNPEDFAWEIGWDAK